MGIIQIASVLASEVTVREIYSHSDAEVLMEYFWKYYFPTFKKLFS